MATNVDIQLAEPRDFGEIITVQRAAYVSDAQSVGNLSTSAVQETVDDLLDEYHRGVKILKALIGTRIVGAGRAEISGDVLTISKMAVAPDLFGSGIGHALLLSLEALASNDVTMYSLTTGQHSLRNRDLYEHWGYEVATVEHGEHGNAVVVMKKARIPLVAE